MEIDKDYNLIVGLRIREIRERMHMTREQFSEKCDLSDSFLAAVESGRKGISSKTIYKICTACNISADYLVLGRNGGFSIDGLEEMLLSLERPYQESSIRILMEYYNSINTALQSKDKIKH